MTAHDQEFYRSLAEWWPLISPVEDYGSEATHFSQLLKEMVGPGAELLELGSGGGHLAYHLSEDFSMTLTDLSPEMLAVSRRLLPGLPHHQGDMRSIRLNRRFDAVIIHDAVCYMLSEEDLGAVFSTAHHHLRSGGGLLVIPDDTTETFRSGSETTTGNDDTGRSVRLVERTSDPDPGETWTRTDYTFTLQDAEGAVTTLSESHSHGLFPEATWLRLLHENGFEAKAVVERTDEHRQPRILFVARALPRGSNTSDASGASADRAS